MLKARTARILIPIAIAVIVVAAGIATTWLLMQPSSTARQPRPGSEACPAAVGLCIERNVTRVIDGDTLEVESDLRIRLVLVDAPESSEAGGPAATEHLTSLCFGTRALVDEDDGQIGADPFGRVLAVVVCDGTNSNAAMIASGLAETYFAFCGASEFRNLAWTGCASAPPTQNCDPAYPDVCIPPPPPDLDCGDIPYTNFRVLPPDPHRFDGDGDGIGCEG